VGILNSNGLITTASGSAPTAMGSSKQLGIIQQQWGLKPKQLVNSTAMGSGTDASGDISTAMEAELMQVEIVQRQW
jgi:hypothetical protein